MARVTFEKVTKSFGAGALVIAPLDLEIADGELLTLVGPSGSGKSTLLDLIAGFEPPTSGRIRIDGELVNHKPPRERGVAMVFQSYALYPHLDVRRNIAFPLQVARVEKKEIAARVAEIAARLGLEAHLDRKPRELSGGQRQRVALGRALVRRPRLCLFDEPLSNLDAALRAQMRAEIKKLHEETGATFVYVTHDQAEAMTLSDRIVVLRGGVVQQAAPPREIYDRPENAFVAGFIGSPAINLVRPEILSLPVLAGRPLLAGVRPERLQITASPGDEAIEGVVYVVEPMGAETWVTLDVRGARVTGRADAEFSARSGDRVWAGFDARHVLLFDAETGERRGAL
ncbi:MAG: ABC transporter ATP-binding protein [Byssovorax sp.]